MKLMCVLLVFCASSFAQTALPCVSRDWTVAYRSGRTANPTSLSGGCIGFALPTPSKSFKKNDYLGYVTTAQGPPDISGFASLSMTFSLTEIGTPVFSAPNEGCIAPVQVRPFFGVNPNDPTYNSTGRWWLNAPGGSQELNLLASGQQVTIGGALNPADWSDAIGEFGNQDTTTQAGFQFAMQHVQDIGFTFGGCFFGHGVQVVGGTAQFDALSFTLN